MPYELIEHTADLKIRVWGSSLENLFFEAVLAMMGLIKPLQITNEYEYTNRIEREVKVEAPDETALLIGFLSEVLTLSQTHKEIYNRVNFERFFPSTDSGQAPVSLEATLEGVRVGEFDEDIKAVTYHEAEVRQNEKGEWETYVVFDI